MENTVIAARIARIRHLFQETRTFAEAQKELRPVLDYLAAADTEFSAVACEAAAMTLALQDLAGNNGLKRWHSLQENTEKYNDTSVHVGLGWALAQEAIPPLAFFPLLTPLMRYRMLDGYGYYEGTFRMRHSIRAQRIPEGLNGMQLDAYSQGTGRSIWYLYAGDAAAIASTIMKFAGERQAALWRGAGLAAAFVGGHNSGELHALAAAAGRYHVQLAAGAAMAAHTRNHLSAMTAGTELACRMLCRHSSAEAVRVTGNAIKDTAAETAYEDWIAAIEKKYSSPELMMTGKQVQHTGI